MRRGDWWPPPFNNGARPSRSAEERHAGRWICWDCPRERWRPPFLPFVLSTHIRHHLRRDPGHRLSWWCLDHQKEEFAHCPHWKLQRWAWVHVGPFEGGCLTVCSYRWVDGYHQDGRHARVIVNDDPDLEKRCDTCGLTTSAFKRRKIPPHDTIDHQRLYFGASVKRGRRLSAREMERHGLKPPVPDVRPLLERRELPGFEPKQGRTS